MRTIESAVVKIDDDNEVFRFLFDVAGDDCADVSLTGVDGVKDLKGVFQRLLAETMKDEVCVAEPKAENGPTGLFVDVCREYVVDLNRELCSARKEIVEEGLAE